MYQTGKRQGIIMYMDDFKVQTDQLINKNKKKKVGRTCRIVDFAIPADHRLKITEFEMWNKYRDLARFKKNNNKKKKTQEKYTSIKRDNDGDINRCWWTSDNS